MKVSVITNRGVGIVRSAANRHEKCEIVGAVSSTHFENTANELATKAGEWWDGAAGTITMVRAGNGSLKVSVSFPATSYAQPLKSVGILVKAQGDERAHVLYAVSDGNTAIALNRPYTCDYEIPVNVSSDTIEDVGSEPVPGLEDYYTKSETDTAIGNAITALNLGVASQKGVDTSIGDASSSNLPTSDAVKAYVDAHSGGVDTSNLGASIAYDSKTKKIELRNADGETLSEIDATAFVKDGMVNNVAIVGDYLVITFNTDAGKEAINIPMSSFFDASAYYTREQIDGGYYTKTEVDNKGYCTRDEFYADLSNYYTKAEINDGYYPKYEIDKNYYTKDGVDRKLDNYYTKTQVDNKGYCTRAEVNENYYTKTQVDSNLENYYTKTEVDNKGYCTEAEVNTKLGDYCTRAEVNDGYYTKTQVDTKLEGYYTKTQVDNKGYCTESEVNVNHYTKAEINDGYYTKSQVDTNHYTKTEINNGYYSKSEIDGGYIANASYNNATNTLTLSSKDGSKQIDLDLS